MEVNVQRAPNTPAVAILKVDGEIDASNYLDVISAVRQLYGDGARQLVVDLTDVTFLSSSGLVALHSSAMIMRGDEPPDPELGWGAFHAIASDVERGFETCCKLYGPRERVLKTLEMTGFSNFLEIYNDLDTAVASF